MTNMSRAYEEIIDFIATEVKPDALSRFQASPNAKMRVAELLDKEKSGSLLAEERAELDRYLELEHVMRLAKARALTQQR
jgi:hypothetical protein